MSSETFKPSPYQEAIYDFMQNGKGNAVIDAVAGSGKTTTIVNALNLIPKDKRVVFVAFNKAIVDELKLRVPQYVDVKTMHSFGFGVLRENYGRVDLNDNKVRYIARTLEPTWGIDEEIADGYIGRVCKLVELAKMNMCTTPDELDDLAYHHNIELYNHEVDNAWQVFNVSRANKKVIDYADMIFMPAYNKLNCPQYDWVLVDECQDLNKAQQSMLRMMIKPGTGRFIAVGDPRQAIYGFAGADANSFHELMSMPNTCSLPLSVNYRCGRSIIELAQTIVPQITAHAGAPEGEIDYKGKWRSVEDGDFVLCRNVRPLIKLCLEMLIEGKKANVRGRELGKNLANMLLRTKKKSFEAAVNDLYKDIERQVKNVMRRGFSDAEARESGPVKTALDKVQAIEVIGAGISSVDRVVEKIEALFTDDRKGIILSTIHKAKGLESRNVFILNPELMPSRWAKKDWEQEQERNLMYVAYTRAKVKLSFIDDYDGMK